MSFSMILLGLFPIILFVLVDLYASPRLAVIISTISAVAMGLFYYWHYGDFDLSLATELMLFVVFGGIALRMNNPRLFKFQPVVVGLVMAGFLGWHWLFYGPYFLKAATLFENVSPELKTYVSHPRFQELLTKLSFDAILVFFLHALVLGFIALKKGNLTWALWRVAIWPILLIVMLVEQFI